MIATTYGYREYGYERRTQKSMTFGYELGHGFYAHTPSRHARFHRCRALELV